ncbi:MAG: hypothetical protein Q7J54_01560 [Candidatus Woesearchaeota archaeon]|nr:hypothetical protein [Candidatus Woesearchaeota archaeon]
MKKLIIILFLLMMSKVVFGDVSFDYIVYSDCNSLTNTFFATASGDSNTFSAGCDGQIDLGSVDDDFKIYLTKLEDGEKITTGVCDYFGESATCGTPGDNQFVYCTREGTYIATIGCDGTSDFDLQMDVKAGDTIETAAGNWDGGGGDSHVSLTYITDAGDYEILSGSSSITYTESKKIASLSQELVGVDGFTTQTNDTKVYVYTNQIVGGELEFLACMDSNQNQLCDYEEDTDYSEGVCVSGGYIWINADGDISTTQDNCCGDDITDNPDLSEEACSACPVGGEADNPALRAWSSTASACCGDDSSDIGYRTSDNSIICTNSTWEWLKADDCRGDIINASGTMYVSNTNGIWQACPHFYGGPIDIATSPTSTQSHGYMCSNAYGAYNIYECRGNGQAYSDSTSGAPICRGAGEGVRNKTGDVVKTTTTVTAYTSPAIIEYGPGQTYYCVDTADKKLWSNDLDIYSEGSCTSAGFSYTGSLCCGEDPHEAYNDLMNPLYSKNCWDERTINNNTILSSNELVKNSGLVEWVDAYNLKSWTRTGDISSYNGGTTRPTAVQLLNGASIESDFIPVTDGVTYTLTYYYSGNVNAKINLYDANKNSASPSTALENSAAVSVGWNPYNLTYTPGLGNGYIKIFLSAASGQRAWFDDVSFKGGKKIVSISGQFYGCDLPTALQAKQDTQHTGNLIINDAFCTNRGGFYCGYLEEWLSNGGLIINHSSSSPSESTTACCQDSQCFNGTICVDDQAGNPYAQAYENKRCINGEWEDAYPKKTWDNAAGYCPEQPQCLVNPSGTYENNSNPEAYFGSSPPQCINGGQFILDHYCENGNWTTRTKQLALTMIRLAGSSEYTLFCDDYANVLNYYNYIITGTKNAKDYISNTCTFGSQINQPCANQVCILNYSDKILFGITLNTNISAFIDVLGLSSCTVTNDGQFHSCDANTKAWYNNASKTLIYSNAAFSMPTTITSSYLKTLSLIFLENPILALHSFINIILQPSFDFGGNPVSFDYSFINQTKDFSHLYMLRTTDKSIFALIENNIPDATGVITKYLVINYTGFSALNICDDYVNRTNKYICYKDDDKFYIAAKPFADKITDAVFDLWRDFTSKLRIQGTGGSIDILYAIADTG